MAFLWVNISRAKDEIHETNFYLHVLYTDCKYYQNENKICVTRPNVMEITRQSEHFDWLKDNRKNHEGLEETREPIKWDKTQRVNSHGCFGVPRGKSFGNLKSKTEMLEAFSQRCAKVLFSKEIT